LKQDFGDTNKALKMASKSAFIDATLKLAGLSDIFTLDLEDMSIEQTATVTPHRTDNSQEKAKTAVPPSMTLISTQQLNVLENIIKNDHIHPDKLLIWLSKVCESKGYPSIRTLSQLPAILVNQVMTKLPEFSNTAD